MGRPGSWSVSKMCAGERRVEKTQREVLKNESFMLSRSNEASWEAKNNSLSSKCAYSSDCSFQLTVGHLRDGMVANAKTAWLHFYGCFQQKSASRRQDCLLNVCFEASLCCYVGKLLDRYFIKH